ncbi:hypothetical protein GCM10022267_90740 [Lentzea roselyniae]|uniref:Uncharacterized protein n=2 Tax=Lentzea roselyniae TaxID=531940 RepID=A0ABP7CJV7_9PSEU
MHRTAEFHRATGLRQPHRDTQRVQLGHNLTELIAVKRALVLAYNDRVEITTRIRGGDQQRRGLRTVPPPPPPRDTYVEELRHDRANAVDQLIRHGALPRARRLHILEQLVDIRP